jgi:hypothetical protein
MLMLQAWCTGRGSAGRCAPSRFDHRTAALMGIPVDRIIA